MQDICPNTSFCNEKASRYRDVVEFVDLRTRVAMPNTPIDLLNPSPAQQEASALLCEAAETLHGRAADHMISVIGDLQGGCEPCPLGLIFDDIIGRDQQAQ